MGKVKVIHGGMLSTIQDLGRLNFQRYGVSVSGAMDDFSARMANLLVQNSPNKAVIETTFSGIELEFLSDTFMAITGAQNDYFLNDHLIPLWTTIKIKKGDLLRGEYCSSGLRNYLAFAGGIQVPFIMGSYSTNLKGKFGGFEGRNLQANDQLELLDQIDCPLASLPTSDIPQFPSEIELRVILGPQDYYFDDQGIQLFFSSMYEVTSESDRMGIRLSGEKIPHKDSADIISDGINLGAIQIPGEGQPIIMMADRQTTGGYAKIGYVITSDIPKLAQASPGTKVRFKQISLAKGLEEYKIYMEKFKKNFIDPPKLSKIPSPIKSIQTKGTIRTYEITISGTSYKVQVE